MIGLRGMRGRYMAGVKGLVGGLLGLSIVVASPAWAGSFDLGSGTSAQYTLTLSYALAVRTKSQADALINGPIDPATGLPTTVNSDDGDRNFKPGSLVNDRVSALGELFLTHGNYGAVLRGNAFFDDVYDRPNANDSPDTVNKTGPYNEFTSSARKYDGERARLLDTYLYGDWSLGGVRHLNLRAGRQVVAWGESVFFSGVSTAQGPVDVTKVNVPGAEVKDILLPINQIAMQLSLTNRLSLQSYYQLQYKENELESVGGYFSTTDVVGPGAQFIYGAPGFTIPRGNDIKPSNYGQWGAGLKYQATPATNFGFYSLRYHDTNPEVQLNIAEVAPGTYAPTSYNARYYGGIRMSALSFSTSVGAANVAGEVSYRDGIDMLVNTAAGPTATRGRLSQALLSSIYTVAPNFISQEIDLVGEVGYVRVNGVDPVGGSSVLTNDRDSWGYEGIATFNYRNVFPKWDLAVPLTYAGIQGGTPAMAGAFGSLYGEGDQRLSVATNFIYLQNFQVGVGYNAFLGSPNLAKRPYADRDNAAINLKYSF